MVMRCLIVAVGAALARSATAITQEEIDAVASPIKKGDYSFLSDVDGRYAGNTYPCPLGDAWWWSPGFGRDDCPEGGFFRRPAR